MEINNEEEFKNFINKDYVLVDFFATWCGPCKMMGPVLENISNNRSLAIAKVDVDLNENLAHTYGVMSIPTLILFKQGQVIDKKVGYVAQPLLEQWLNDNQ
ncbi:MAG: thioredoxin [Bacilli bacterium]